MRTRSHKPASPRTFSVHTLSARPPQALSQEGGALSSVRYLVLQSFPLRLDVLRSKQSDYRSATHQLMLAGVSEKGVDRGEKVGEWGAMPLPATITCYHHCLTTIARYHHLLTTITSRQMCDLDMIVLSAFLAVPEGLPLLQTLRLDDNRIGAAGCAALGAAMGCGSSAALRSLLKLYLQRNAIGDMGLKQLTVRRPTPRLRHYCAAQLPLSHISCTHLIHISSAPPAISRVGSRRRCVPVHSRS